VRGQGNCVFHLILLPFLTIKIRFWELKAVKKAVRKPQLSYGSARPTSCSSVRFCIWSGQLSVPRSNPITSDRTNPISSESAGKSIIELQARYCTISQMWETGRISKETLDDYTDTLNENQIEIVTFFEQKRLQIRADIATFLTNRVFP